MGLSRMTLLRLNLIPSCLGKLRIIFDLMNSKTLFIVIDTGEAKAKVIIDTSFVKRGSK